MNPSDLGNMLMLLDSSARLEDWPLVRKKARSTTRLDRQEFSNSTPATLDTLWEWRIDRDLGRSASPLQASTKYEYSILVQLPSPSRNTRPRPTGRIPTSTHHPFCCQSLPRDESQLSVVDMVEILTLGACPPCPNEYRTLLLVYLCLPAVGIGGSRRCASQSGVDLEYFWNSLTFPLSTFPNSSLTVR